MHLEFSTNAVARRNVINKDFLLQERRRDASLVIRMVSKNVSVSGSLIRSSHLEFSNQHVTQNWSEEFQGYPILAMRKLVTTSDLMSTQESLPLVRKLNCPEFSFGVLFVQRNYYRRRDMLSKHQGYGYVPILLRSEFHARHVAWV